MSATHGMRRGALATYRPAHVLDRRIRVEVRAVHRDGTVTVETMHELDEEGQAAGPWLGDMLTLDAGELTQ